MKFIEGIRMIHLPCTSLKKKKIIIAANYLFFHRARHVKRLKRLS